MIKQAHPYTGGRKTAGVTKRHRALIWECMLGTVMAHRPGDREARYFDYDWDGARQHVDLANCTDLRISRSRLGYADGPRKGQLALWGIPKPAASI